MSFDKLERSVKAYVNTPMNMESPEPITLCSLADCRRHAGRNAAGGERCRHYGQR